MKKSLSYITSKIKDKTTALLEVQAWKQQGHRIVFTNGCFDLLHYGHLHYLAAARDLGDKLIIGLNSDESVQRLKGLSRPVNDSRTRSTLLAGLECVDMVVFFEEDTPLNLITNLLPDVLVKGGDYIAEKIVGYQEISQNGGEVKILSFQEGYSSTKIIEKIKKV